MRDKNGRFIKGNSMESLREKISISCKKSGVGKWAIGNKNVSGKRWKIKDTSNMGKHLLGEKHFRYIKDRTQLKKHDRRNDYAYVDWRKNVWIRDKWKCRINNPDCSGRLEAHHILRWNDHPELRYEVNNGITLCHFHHPRKIKDEIKLSPYFQELVGNQAK